MKYRISFLFLLLFCVQYINAQVTIFAGPQLTTANYTIRGTHQPTGSNTAFMAGGSFTTQVEAPFYFTPSVYFSRKGYKVTYNQFAFPPGDNIKANNVTLSSVELAALGEFQLSKSPSHGFIRFGPAFDIYISGTERMDSVNNKRVTKDMVFDFAEYSYVTIGVNAQIGYQHQSGFLIFAHYQQGLSSLNNADGGPVIHNRVVGISVGWRLGRRK